MGRIPKSAGSTHEWCGVSHDQPNLSNQQRMSGYPDSKIHGAYMGPTWTQMGPMLSPWTLLTG